MTTRAIDVDLALELPGLSLRVEARLPGGVTAIMGPSGAGKTSLLEAIAGLRGGARGRVAVGGEVLLDTPRRIALAPERRRVSAHCHCYGIHPVILSERSESKDLPNRPAGHFCEALSGRLKSAFAQTSDLRNLFLVGGRSLGRRLPQDDKK